MHGAELRLLLAAPVPLLRSCRFSGIPIGISKPPVGDVVAVANRESQTRACDCRLRSSQPTHVEAADAAMDRQCSCGHCSGPYVDRKRPDRTVELAGTVSASQTSSPRRGDSITGCSTTPRMSRPSSIFIFSLDNWAPLRELQVMFSDPIISNLFHGASLAVTKIESQQLIV
jgi:hypothetical protein